MLRLENLAKLYGLKVVFKGVSCRFTAGSITLLAGGNGAGKSTLLRIIAGLSRPSAGEVIFDGTGVGGVAREDGPRLAYLGHATFVYPGLSALENLQFWARAHGLRPSRAELLALLEHVGLAAHAEERAGVFSRGMAQRLNLARVLLLDADLVLLDEPGTLNAPLGFIEDMKTYASHLLNVQGGSVTADMVKHQKSYSIVTTAHPFTGIHITEKGLDYLENYVREVREVIGYDVPLAIDHFGHVCVEDCIRFAKRMEPYNLAWMEDMVPWIYTDQYVRLKNSCAVPVCTGEDIYLKEGFETLIKAGGVSVIHPDILTCGGALEMKKIADIADEHGVAVAIHMAESPVACMAAVHTAAAMHNVLALEFHSVDVPWWKDMVVGLPDPLIENGFIKVPEKPGLGFDDLNEEVLKAHINPRIPGYFEPTDEWNMEFSNDRIWS